MLCPRFELLLAHTTLTQEQMQRNISTATVHETSARRIFLISLLTLGCFTISTIPPM